MCVCVCVCVLQEQVKDIIICVCVCVRVCVRACAGTKELGWVVITGSILLVITCTGIALYQRRMAYRERLAREIEMDAVANQGTVVFIAAPGPRIDSGIRIDSSEPFQDLGTRDTGTEAHFSSAFTTQERRREPGITSAAGVSV